MGFNTAIEWATHTFNAWIGCEPISPACDHCYASRWAKRYGRDFAERTRTSPAYWRMPLAWDRLAARAGARPRVFCNSLADVFDNKVPPAWRRDLFDLIWETPHLDWLLLTKRIGNVEKMLLDAARSDRAWPWWNVWIVATIGNQEEAYRDIPKLLRVPARVRGLSIEPMLSPISLRWLDGFDYRKAMAERGRVGEYDAARNLHWVICGGESGPNARPMHPGWARALRDQCAAAGVPFFFKQWGEWGPPDFAVASDREAIAAGYGRGAALGDSGAFEDRGNALLKVGKKRAGRVLDGRTHDGFPAATLAALIAEGQWS